MRKEDYTPLSKRIAAYVKLKRKIEKRFIEEKNSANRSKH